MIVAACQTAPDQRSVDDATAAVAAVRQAAVAGAGLVVLPELAVCGYWFERAEHRHLVPDRDEVVTRELAKVSAELDIVVVCGVPRTDGQTWWNAAVVLDRGQTLGTYRKVHLWGRESTFFTADDNPPLVLDTSAGRLGVMICYDLEFPEWARLAAEAGAEILAVGVNWPRNDHPGQHPVEVAKAQSVAAAYGVAVVIADRYGTEQGVDWEGGSLICGPDGYLIAGPATAPGETAGPALLVAELEPAAAQDKSRGAYNDLMLDRRPELYVSTPRPTALATNV